MFGGLPQSVIFDILSLLILFVNELSGVSIIYLYMLVLFYSRSGGVVLREGCGEVLVYSDRASGIPYEIGDYKRSLPTSDV